MVDTMRSKSSLKENSKMSKSSSGFFKAQIKNNYHFTTRNDDKSQSITNIQIDQTRSETFTFKKVKPPQALTQTKMPIIYNRDHNEKKSAAKVRTISSNNNSRTNIRSSNTQNTNKTYTSNGNNNTTNFYMQQSQTSK